MSNFRPFTVEKLKPEDVARSAGNLTLLVFDEADPTEKLSPLQYEVGGHPRLPHGQWKQARKIKTIVMVATGYYSPRWVVADTHVFLRESVQPRYWRRTYVPKSLVTAWLLTATGYKELQHD
jgi:hypothetical protein